MVPSLPVIIPDNLIGQQLVNDVSQKITAVKNRLTGPGASLFARLYDTFPSFFRNVVRYPPVVHSRLTGAAYYRVNVTRRTRAVFPLTRCDGCEGMPDNVPVRLTRQRRFQVSFNPQFFSITKETTVPDKLSGALNMSLHELEKCWRVCWPRNNAGGTNVCGTGGYRI